MIRRMFAVVVTALVVSCAASQENSADVVFEVSATATAVLSRPAVEWTVLDVVYWMNVSMGFPEYAAYISLHGVDGPTLLAMTPEMFDLYFPIRHELHLVKLKAHLSLLHKKCLCPGQENGAAAWDVNLWSLLERENWRMWVLGGIALPFPRIAMLLAYVADYEGLYQPLVHGDAEENVALDVIFFVCLVLVPDAFLAYQASRLVWVNWIIAPFIVLHFCFEQYNELFLIRAIYRKEAFEPGATWWRCLYDMRSWFWVLPAFVLITHYVLPLLLQKLLVLVFVGHVLLVLIGLTMVLTGNAKTSPENTSDHNNTDPQPSSSPSPPATGEDDGSSMHEKID